MHRWFGKRGKLVRGLIISLALLLILLEWITRLLAGAVHSVVALLGLTRFEMWMRGLPLWCVAPITLTVAAGYGLLEFTQFALLARQQYMLAGLGSVEIWGSPKQDIVIQAGDGPICAKRYPVGENAAALPGEEIRSRSQR